MQADVRGAHTVRREGDIVHFLTNQLTVILGFAELLADGLPDDDPRREGLTDILAAARAAVDRMPELSERLREAA